MKIISIAEANGSNFKYRDHVAAEATKLADEINAAILAADENNTSRWCMGNMDTNLVVYVDVTEYLPDVVDTVVGGLVEAGYGVQSINLGTEDGVMKLLCIIWDIDVSAILNCAVALHNVGDVSEFLGDEEEDEDDEAPASCGCLADLASMLSEYPAKEDKPTEGEDLFTVTEFHGLDPVEEVKETAEGDGDFSFGEVPVATLSEEQALSGSFFDIPDEEQGGEELV